MKDQRLAHELDPKGLDKHAKNADAITLVLCIEIMLASMIALYIITVGSMQKQIADFELLLSYSVMSLIGVTGLVVSTCEYPFSMTQVHWIFYLFFLMIPSLSQYVHGTHIWGYQLSKQDYLITNMYLIAWGILYQFASTSSIAMHSHRTTGREHQLSINRVPLAEPKKIVRLLILSALVTSIVVSVVGFEGLFSRSEYHTGMDKTITLLFEKVLRPMPVFVFVTIFNSYKYRNIPRYAVIGAFTLMIVSNFPTAFARNITAGLYGGTILSCVRPIREKTGLFPLLLIVLYVIVFPAQGVFRSEIVSATTLASALMDAVKSIPKGFLAVDYDAYSMLARSIIYVRANGATWGRQLIGVLLFFIPRSVWPSKPIGSGDLIGMSQAQQVLNISCPLPAEGIVNFGLLGLLLMAVISGRLSKFLNDMYWNSNRTFPYYPFLCVMFFFILRGDLLSSFAFTVGMGVSCYIVNKLATDAGRPDGASLTTSLKL